MKSNFKSFQRILILLLIFIGLLSACKKDPISINSDDKNADNIPARFVGTGISFSQSGPIGGGFPNVVTWDPNEPGKIYYGSDIGGTGKSIDWGKNFESAARGLGYKPSHEKIAVLNAVNINNSTVIVGGTGFKGTGGEVISSVDGADTWNVDSEDIKFSAQNSDSPLPTGRPRSTDTSLIQWVGGSTWIAGTYKEGVWISTDNRSNWRKIRQFHNNANVRVRAMAMSPNDPNTVYVGLWGDAASLEKGLWKISNLNGTPSVSKVSGIPDVVESIVVLGNRIYLACGKFGVRKYIPSSNTVENITGVIDDETSVMATAIHGSVGNSNSDMLVVGTAEGRGHIWLSRNSGSTWENTTNNNVNTAPWGSDENLIVFEKHRNWALGGSKCDVASVQVSPHDPDAWVVCSTSAIWTTDDAGANWRPANGFQILSYRDVEISESGLIGAGNVDHDIIVSNDGGSRWESIGLGGVTVSHALAFSPNGNEVAFANNERDNNTEDAKLGVASTPGTPSSPNLLEIDNRATPSRIVGLSWFKFPKGTERLIMAMDEGGIQTVDRGLDDGIWDNWQVRSRDFMKSQDNRDLRCSMVTTGKYTFVYDRQSGVWRSRNYGVDWDQILTTTAGSDQGYLAYDEDNDRLYISTPTEVLRMNNASTSNLATNLSFPTDNPGAMALDPSGRLLVFAKPLNASNSDSALYRSENPGTNENSWIDIADNNLKRIAPTVTDLDASDEYIVLVTAGKGMIISSNDAPQQ